jgi:hypothetical protein
MTERQLRELDLKRPAPAAGMSKSSSCTHFLEVEPADSPETETSPARAAA